MESGGREGGREEDGGIEAMRDEETQTQGNTCRATGLELLYSIVCAQLPAIR